MNDILTAVAHERARQVAAQEERERVLDQIEGLARQLDDEPAPEPKQPDPKPRIVDERICAELRVRGPLTITEIRGVLDYERQTVVESLVRLRETRQVMRVDTGAPIPTYRFTPGGPLPGTEITAPARRNPPADPNRRQHVYDFIAAHAGCPTGAIMRELELTRPQVVAQLKALVVEARIQREGAGAGTRYFTTEARDALEREVNGGKSSPDERGEEVSTGHTSVRLEVDGTSE